MEHAEEHHPFEERDDRGTHHLLGRDPGALHPADVVPGEAVEALHDEHPRRDEPGVRPGHDDRALLGRGDDRGDVEHALGLEAEVELLDDRLGEQLDERRWVGEDGDGDPPDEVRREEAHHGEVVLHEGGDLGSLHLDDDFFAGVEAGAVHLGDRGRGDGLGRELAEHLLEGAAEIGLDALAHGCEGLSRDPVAQQLELADELGREDPLARGEDLAELDVGRTEPLEREAESARQPGPRFRCLLAPVGQVPAGDRPAEDRRHPHDPAPRREPVPPDETRYGRTGFGAHEIEADPPRQVLGLDEPGRMVRERPDRQVPRRWGRAQGATGPNTRHPLCPPKPKLFESTGPGVKGRAVPVTMSR